MRTVFRRLSGLLVASFEKEASTGLFRHATTTLLPNSAGIISFQLS